MSISLTTYAGSTVVPQDDAMIYETTVNQSGIFRGCAITKTDANVITIDSGWGMICGRHFKVRTEDIVIPLETEGEIPAQLYIEMDLGNYDAPIQFKYEKNDPLSDMIQQEDINYINGRYQMQLATFTVSTTGIDNLQKTYKPIVPWISFIGTMAEYEERANLIPDGTLIFITDD